MANLCVDCRCDCRGAAGVLCLSLSALVWCVAAPAGASDVTWITSSGGSFSDEANWVPDLPFSSDVPDVNDIAHFGLTTSSVGSPVTYTVTFSTDPTNQRLIVEDDRVTFDLNGHTYRATSPIAVVLGTESGRLGRLAVMDGFLSTPLQADIEIGSVAGSSGTLQVLTDGLVLGSPEIFVGVNGGGTLSIFNGGDVIADNTTLGLTSGVTGTATITGGGSSLLADQLVVGSSGIGMLNITAGGRVDSTDGIVGDAVGSTGTVTVSGANSRWQMSDWLRVGFSGDGTLRIEDGGTVRDEVALVKGSAVVTGGSTWINEFTLNVGTTSASPGNLTIESGSQVQSGESNLAISNGGNAFALVRDSGTTWTCTDALNVGLAGEGALTIESGAAITSGGGGIAVGGASNGTARITGSTSTWSTSGDFVVGDAGDGQLDISSGQLLFTNESDLIVGDAGSGRMTINSGGQALDAFETVIGNLAGSTGELTVTGSGSQLRTLDRLTVGGGGRGTLLIVNEGRVSNDVGIISGVDSSVRVQGNNSTWTNGSVLNLFDNAALVIEGGGTVVSLGSDVSGSVTVAGAGSTWDITHDLIGGLGGGTLRIQPGGAVNVGDTITLHDDDELRLEGGVLSTGHIQFGGATTPFIWTSGTLHLGLMNAGLTIPSGGVLAPGVELGTTDISQGDVTLSPGGTLQMQIGGVNQGSTYDYLDVLLGDVILAGGNLQLSLLNGFVPSPTNTFTIVDVLGGIVAGSFANVASGARLATSDGLGSFIVSYSDGSSVRLSSFQLSVPGDYNQNGTVDAADYVLWRKKLGSGTSLPNDNTPGIGSDDYTRWRTRFGQTAGSGSAANSTVPEPASALLLLLAAAAMGRRGRRIP
jgi:T5SS/PEP-CTERM-associated repeat protein